MPRIFAEPRVRTMVSVIVVVAHILGFLSSIHAVMTTRTAQGAIAWGVSLNAFPYLSVPAYWVFGRRKFSGYVEARRDLEAEILDSLDEAVASFDRFVVDPEERMPAYEAIKSLARSKMLRGNALELLIDGDATFDSILEGIRAATEHIVFQFYILKDDGLGSRVEKALTDKARQGVDVYVLFDEVGSHKLPRTYIERMRDAGVHISAFNTTQGRRNRFQLNFRNHRKIVVVDGRTAWIGGHNVGDEYLGLDPKFGPWRDTHLRIEGPAALAAQAVFYVDWYWATRSQPRLSWQPHASDSEDRLAMVLPSSPADSVETAQLFFVHALNSARERIWIASPYFVPDEAVLTALQLAALRGVDVRVLIPDHADHMLVYLTSFWFIDELEDSGVHFYRYREGFLHQKVMLVDDQISTVGTVNFDNRSFRLNFEITALVADAEFAGEVEAMLLRDMERSRLVGANELADRSFPFRLAVNFSRLTAPIL